MLPSEGNGQQQQRGLTTTTIVERMTVTTVIEEVGEEWEKKEKKTKAKYVDLLHLQANGGGCNQSCHLLQLSLTVID